MTKLFAVVADALSVPFLGAAPTAHADAYCELGNLLIPQEAHHVGTYRDATCATVADIVTTSDDSDCVRAVTNYVVSRGQRPLRGQGHRPSQLLSAHWFVAVSLGELFGVRSRASVPRRPRRPRRRRESASRTTTTARHRRLSRRKLVDDFL